MFWFFLACTSPASLHPSTHQHAGGLIQEVVPVDSESIGPGMSSDLVWGSYLATGIDLDHDGVKEWAASDVKDGEVWSANVRVVEGRTTLTERTANPAHNSGEPAGYFGEFLDGGGDTDGDGFGELLLTDERIFVPNRVHLVRSTEAKDDVSLELPAVNGSEMPREVLFVRRPGPDLILTFHYHIGTNFRFDMFDLEVGVKPELWATEGPAPISGGMGNPVAVDVDGDGYDEVLVGTFEADVGWLHLCDGHPVGTLREGCFLEIYNDVEQMGAHQAAGDIDGDGLAELMSGNAPDGGEDGHLLIYNLQGEQVARIAGTQGAMFGAFPLVLTDVDGEPWLVVSERVSPNEARAYAFHGSQLKGDLVDTDAARIYSLGRPGSLHHARRYQSTPDAPLQILFSEPGYDGGRVYLVDWVGL